ncbi:ankyrin repeat and MYND domain-containing protein 1 [Carcharodon carcharias]|uniref:ankyrin repeat and MYND domain-containing protein 1 n=1 Tax=Carcharodon carcharias TaxID=13397 RepID=UPI001B7E5006|nr:ankyrin repeat and MYND domain-containing protein 1 [Carcharodon carcharias]
MPSAVPPSRPDQDTSASPQPHSPVASQQIQDPLSSPELIKATPAQSILELNPPPEVGVQEWPNGWKYEGEFEGNLKHGQGAFRWANGEYYVGQFYKDHRHGKGTYVWPDGNKFTGMFYLDRKDGYGTLEMKDGSVFQGLYKADERFGPGVLTHSNGRQDVGLWYRNHIIRLCSEIPGAFTVKNHPMYHPEEKELVIPMKTYKEKYFWRTDPKEDPFFYLYKKFLFDDNYTLPEEIEIYSTDADHLPLTRSYTREGDRHFFQEEELGDKNGTYKITIINQTPLMVKMQMHIHRHRYISRHAQAKLSWDVAAVIEGKREGFGPKGPLECSSEQLIIEAGEGNHEKVRKILKTKLVSADVADVHGHMSLIGASAVGSSVIVNLLLDNGANVNKLNNEGVSALNCCCILYYPSGSFLHSEIYRLSNKKAQLSAAIAPAREEMQEETDDELTTQVKMAKRISLYDSKIKVSSISFKKLAAIALSSESTSKMKWPAERQAAQEGRLNFEDSAEEEGLVLETDEDTDSLLSPSAGPPSTTNFDSSRSVRHYQFNVTGRQLQRAAQVLSRNQHFKSSADKSLGVPDFKHDEGVWRMAVMKSRHQRRRGIISLLLQRGADPNNSTVPMPPLFFPILAGDLNAIKLLLENKADPNYQLQAMNMAGLLPLHVAVAIPGKKGVAITELLLNAAANPDKGAKDDNEIYPPDVPHEPQVKTGFILKSPNASGVPSHYHTPPEIAIIEDGRTPLHIACQWEDNYKNAHQIVRLLLRHKANPNLLWSGHSPLSLAIASGNDLAVDELLANGADPNLPLTRSLGNALCTALNTSYERKRSLGKRQALIVKLLNANANILMPVNLVSRDGHVTGTALDYGYYKYYQDSKIAQTPYHALTPEEREIYNARRQLLNFLSQPFRNAAITKERKREEATRKMQPGIIAACIIADRNERRRIGMRRRRLAHQREEQNSQDQGSAGPPLDAEDVGSRNIMRRHLAGAKGSTGDLYEISQAFTTKCIHDVTESLFAKAHNYINFDRDLDHQHTGFAEISRFPRVQGAINYTHVTDPGDLGGTTQNPGLAPQGQRVPTKDMVHDTCVAASGSPREKVQSLWRYRYIGQAHHRDVEDAIPMPGQIWRDDLPDVEMEKLHVSSDEEDIEEDDSDESKEAGAADQIDSFVVNYSFGLLTPVGFPLEIFMSDMSAGRESSETQLQLSESEALSYADISMTGRAIFERHAQVAEGNLPASLASEKKSKVQDTAPRFGNTKYKRIRKRCFISSASVVPIVVYGVVRRNHVPAPSSLICLGVHCGALPRAIVYSVMGPRVLNPTANFHLDNSVQCFWKKNSCDESVKFNNNTNSCGTGVLTRVLSNGRQLSASALAMYEPGQYMNIERKFQGMLGIDVGFGSRVALYGVVLDSTYKSVPQHIIQGIPKLTVTPFKLSTSCFNKLPVIALNNLKLPYLYTYEHVIFSMCPAEAHTLAAAETGHTDICLLALLQENGRQLFKFKFCYSCGRSVGVRLINCSRCKEVYYCSKACKVTAWNEFHKDECYLSKSRTPTKKGKANRGGFFRGDELNWSHSSSPSVELDNYSFN